METADTLIRDPKDEKELTSRPPLRPAEDGVLSRSDELLARVDTVAELEVIKYAA